MGSRSGILICRVGDDVLQVLWELLWLSVCDSEVVGVVVESFEGVGRTSGDGAATW